MPTTTTYLLKKNGAAPATLASLGLVAADPNYRANGIDTLTLQTVDNFDGPALFAYNDTVSLILRTTTSAIPPVVTDTCVFTGSIRAIPRNADDQAHAITYTAENAVKVLQRCTYAQQWRVFQAGATTITEPRVILGENNSGTRLKNGDMIAEILTYAASAGVSLQLGTFVPGTYTPYDERENITCWDAIIAMLRYTPDYVLSVDYTTTPPTFSLIAPDSMPTISKAVRNVDITDAGITPRYDIQIPGISIMFRYSGSIDGTLTKHVAVQTAGNTSHRETVRLVYDLEGPQITYVRQTIEVEDYPDSLSAWQSPTGKAFIAARCPELKMTGVTYTVNQVNSSGIELYPAALLSGSIQPWMHVNQEAETFTVEIDFTIKDASGNIIDSGTKEVFFKETSTDGLSKEYKKQDSYIGAEPVPPDMAANLYASWSRLHYDGEITLTLPAHTFDLLPGTRLNLTGSYAPWATMAAIVQDADYNLAAGTVNVTFGTCDRLEADNLMAIYRAARGRRYAYNRTGRSTEESTDNSLDGQTAAPNGNAAGGAATARTRFRIEAPDADANQVAIDINPASIAYADATNKDDQTLQLRERIIPYRDDSGNLKAKLAQLLCSEGYGDEQTLGEDRPSDPSNPLTLLALPPKALPTMHLPILITARLLRSPKDGVKVFLETRDRFMDTGSKTLYCYGRWLTFPAAIAPSISAETRIEVDKPQA